MLKLALRNKINPPELRLLYDSKILLSHPTINSMIVNEIRRIRTEIKQKTMAPGTDRVSMSALEAKLKKYKNDGGWAREKALEYNKALYLPKAVPTDFHGHWRSIEFELLFKTKEDRDIFGSGVRSVPGLKNLVVIKDDASIKPNDGDTKAVRNEITLTYRHGDDKPVHDLCRLLRGRAYVNKTCGTHVHFDMRHLADVEATTYAKRIARCVPALKMMLPKSRRNSDFCKEAINSIVGGAAGQRYCFVNLHSFLKYKTLEIRGHSGTINADKILSWIKLCESIMSTDLSFKPDPKHNVSAPVNTIEELISQINLDSETARYVKERYETFNPKAVVAGAPDAEEGEDVPVGDAAQPGVDMTPVAIPPAPINIVAPPNTPNPVAVPAFVGVLQDG